MRNIQYAVIASLVAIIMPLAAARTYAGGGGKTAGGVVVQVDGDPVPNHNYAFNAFYPEVVSVHQGDTVTWNFANNKNAYHTITLLAGPTGFSRGLPPSILDTFFPKGGPTVPDADDGAGTQIYNYNTRLGIGCGHSSYFPASSPCSYTGRILNSGLIINPVRPGTGTPVPGAQRGTFTVRMNTRPGTYLYFCLLHMGMNGIIHVTKPGAPLPSAAAVVQQAKTAYQRDVAAAIRAEAKVRATQQTVGGHTVWSVRAGLVIGSVEIDEMMPRDLRIRPGDTVKWKLARDHTVTFPAETGLFEVNPTCEAAGQDISTNWNLSRCATTLELNENARANAPSGKSGLPYTGGFYNSGTFADKWSASFPNAGTIRYDCIIHTGMDGSVSVG